MRYVHYLLGGGLGDVVREALYNNVIGVLKAWKRQHPEAHLTLVLMSHNESTPELFTGQDWLDDVVRVDFPQEPDGEWDISRVYRDHPELFADAIELKFHLKTANGPTLYNTAEVPKAKAGKVEWLEQFEQDDWGPVLTELDQKTADFYKGRFVIHPHAGEKSRWFTDDIKQNIDVWFRQLGVKPLVIGAGDYGRPGAEFEGGICLNPRALLAVLKSAKAVIATESSVYYQAAMLGTPVAMLYAPGQGYHKMLHSGRYNWYFIGDTDQRNLFLEMPLRKLDWKRLERWIEEKR